MAKWRRWWRLLVEASNVAQLLSLLSALGVGSAMAYFSSLEGAPWPVVILVSAAVVVLVGWGMLMLTNAIQRWYQSPQESQPSSRDKAAGAVRIRTIGNKASEPWLELVHLAVLVPEGVEAKDARISAKMWGNVYSLMWSTNEGPKDERTLRADADNDVLIVIRSAQRVAFNPWGHSRPPVSIAQDISYIADSGLLAHQRVDSSRHLPTGRHQVVVIVTWGEAQQATQAFDVTIPPSTSAPIVLTETPASVA
jgi:hypothetical protein